MIIFLNGSINAGKSTVAKILAKEIKNSALLKIDAIYDIKKKVVSTLYWSLAI